MTEKATAPMTLEDVLLDKINAQNAEIARLAEENRWLRKQKDVLAQVKALGVAPFYIGDDASGLFSDLVKDYGPAYARGLMDEILLIDRVIIDDEVKSIVKGNFRAHL